MALLKNKDFRERVDNFDTDKEETFNFGKIKTELEKEIQNKRKKYRKKIEQKERHI